MNPPVPMPVPWANEHPAAITVCDRSGIILEMNEAAARVFEKDGGTRLIGSNLLACHPEPSRTKLAGMLASGQSNIYSIQKNGRKKLICQMPWFEGGECAGFVEWSFEIPLDMPHFNRDAPVAHPANE